MTSRLIFQLGTNNWQRAGEFAPGSGILHEAHHAAYNRIPGTRAYSVYPSTTQKSDDPQVRIFELDHDVPICESISPVSSYRFHSMSETEFDAYVARLQDFVRAEIEATETAEGREIDLAIAHHCFLNPLLLSRINDERAAAGRKRFKILCFVHGTALKMFAHEKAAVDPEYPRRFLDLMERERIFADANKIDACAAISNEQLEKFADVYADYPRDRMVLSPNGYDQNVFKPSPEEYVRREELLPHLELAPSPSERAPESITDRFGKVVVFCGKFADWKRLDSLLEAASHYEKDSVKSDEGADGAPPGPIVTLVIGSGPDDAVEHYHRLAYEQLGLRHTYFLGPQPHAEIARLNAIADLGVYPSKNEPFGLVLIEAMGCGTPVIGADSGGPRDFVTQETGSLIPESDDHRVFVDRLTSEIRRALAEDWKASKGPAASRYATEHFSIDGQCRELLTAIDSAASQAH